MTRTTCGHCASSVREELGELPGVRAVEVDLGTARARRKRFPAAGRRTSPSPAAVGVVRRSGDPAGDGAGPAVPGLAMGFARPGDAGGGVGCVAAAYLWSLYALFFGGAGVIGMRHSRPPCRARPPWPAVPLGHPQQQSVGGSAKGVRPDSGRHRATTHAA
ncbi:heavy-metal-associated domain-containing protein [Amycolatopsis sp. NBC_01488]|uniref:heavy-metal-associated domain-containing protein n=1 Tax=Amycolatopsis sp. NBC_01488 TaxID=2903563 RepID=UPI002E2A0B1A|nr:cation transporter [Amycolatopsis sp. NBC_01488]